MTKKKTLPPPDKPFQLKFQYGANDNLELMEETLKQIVSLVQTKGLSAKAIRHLFINIGTIGQWLQDTANLETKEVKGNG